MIRAVFDAASRSAIGARPFVSFAPGALSDIHDLRAVLCAPCDVLRGLTTAPVRFG
ncbi:hypothetical protein MXD81_52330 [Microbacteriaceae bacterium K1510]|nr:hypothetical protein [Microbacteriaceae bacterium K1510]